jgi:hypothetical protein
MRKRDVYSNALARLVLSVRGSTMYDVEDARIAGEHHT